VTATQQYAMWGYHVSWKVLDYLSVKEWEVWPCDPIYEVKVIGA